MAGRLVKEKQFGMVRWRGEERGRERVWKGDGVVVGGVWACVVGEREDVVEGWE